MELSQTEFGQLQTMAATTLKIYGFTALWALEQNWEWLGGLGY